MSEEQNEVATVLVTDADFEEMEFRRALFNAIERAGAVPVILPEPFDGGPDIIPPQSHERVNR